MDEPIAQLPDLEGDELIQFGNLLFRYDRLLDINTDPKLVFVLVKHVN